MSVVLYRLFLALYRTGILVVSLGNSKAKLWLSGRKAFPAIDYKNVSHDVLWMHCASLGEFEQGRPLLEEIRVQYPACKIVLTFFSPSGYEIAKNFKGADHIFYLPGDSASNAKRFIEQVSPTLVLWVRYEYWFYYLNELQKQNISSLMISAVYRKNMPFFKWYGALWKKMLASFMHFFVQNQSSKDILATLINADKITNSGDTRFDRVISIAEKFEHIPGIAEFCASSRVIVAGSTWEDDEAEWIHYVKNNPEIKFIIAPHEIDRENLAFVKKEFPNSIFYSQWIAGGQPATGNHRPFINCLIIDNIGMLSRLYKYATICFVGGGFGSDGLHNILEAAVYGKPVLFGPEFDKNFEAIDLVENGGGIAINSALELEKILTRLFNDHDELHQRSEAAQNYVYEQAGATGKIMQFIQKNRLLTN